MGSINNIYLNMPTEPDVMNAAKVILINIIQYKRYNKTPTGIAITFLVINIFKNNKDVTNTEAKTSMFIPKKGM
ncbi:hypothetical protein MASR2M36_28600 [Providencia sp.]